MLPNTVNPIRIDITTYKPNKLQKKTKMNTKVEKHDKQKFMCTICLNRRDEMQNIKRKISKTCPICYKNEDIEKKVFKNEITELYKMKYSKAVQTEKDMKGGFNLLNEVLTEFQNKKLESKSKWNVKDACVSTDCKKPRLCYSKVFKYTVEGNLGVNQFTLICSSKEDMQENESINPIKYKSSSIPLMKMEELKNSLKEKPKSKDTIEEVNRMFANVRRNNNLDEFNRPIVRNGPRILPVVQTKIKPNYDDNGKRSCKCCQTINCMSSGDSLKPFVEQDSFHNKRCDKCVYMLCCHYKNCKMEGLICEECRSDFRECGPGGSG